MTKEKNFINKLTTSETLKKLYSLKNLLNNKIKPKGYLKIYTNKAKEILSNKNDNTLKNAITCMHVMMQMQNNYCNTEFKRSQICIDLSAETKNYQNAEMIADAYDFCKEQLSKLTERQNKHTLSEKNKVQKLKFEQMIELSKVEYLAVFLLDKIAISIDKNEKSNKDASYAYSKILEIEGEIKIEELFSLDSPNLDILMDEAEAEVTQIAEENQARMDLELDKFIEKEEKKRCCFSREGDAWMIVYKGKMLPTIKHTDGFTYIEILLKNKKKIFPISKLFEIVKKPYCNQHELLNSHKNIFGDGATSQESLFKEYGMHIETDNDEKIIPTKDLKKIKEDIKKFTEIRDTAKKNGNTKRYNELNKKIHDTQEFLKKYLNHKGKPRSFPTQLEKQRQAIKHAINTAFKKIKKHNENLEKHLKQFIKTGYQCSYNPPQEIDIEWKDYHIAP